MKRILFFVLLFAVTKVSGQTTGYFRYDTVRIMKQNGSCELYIINKTKDSLGLLTNIGGGLTSFRRSRNLTDSTFNIGLDTITRVGGAFNGLSMSGGRVRLGGTLTQNTDISMAGDSLRFTDSGYVRIRTNSGNVAPLIVENKTPGGFENIYGIGDNVAWRLYAKKASGFAGLTYYSGPGDTLRGATGYDGNFPHLYIMDIKGTTPSATIESNGSTFAGFTLTKNMFLGDPPMADTARFNLYTLGTGITSSAASNRWFVGQNYGSTFNTTGGAITNRTFILDNSASRSTGAPSLTNITLYLNARNGQTNQALRIDSGDLVVRGVGSSIASMNVADFATVANLGVTQKRAAGWFEVGRTFTDTAAGTQTFSSAVYGRSDYSAKGSATITDNISGSGGEFMLSLARNTSYTGRTVYQGLFTPSNNVTTMAAGLSARFNMSQTNTGGNSVRTNGWFAALSTHIALNVGDSLSNFVWGNFGAMQSTGGAIDSGYGVYINAFPSIVATKYALYQAGSNDSSIYKGPAKFFNLQADKTITTGGTTGDQTINKISGTVNFAAGATTLTVTNTLITANSIILPVIRTVDATAKYATIVSSLGSFTITLNAAATAETSVGFFVVN